MIVPHRASNSCAAHWTVASANRPCDLSPADMPSDSMGIIWYRNLGTSLNSTLPAANATGPSFLRSAKSTAFGIFKILALAVVTDTGRSV